MPAGGLPGPDRAAREGPGLLPGPSHFLRLASPRFSIEGLIMNLPTKLGIIGLGVMVMMLLGVAVLMLWRS